MKHQFDQVPFALVARRQTGSKVMALEVEHNPGLVVDKELVLEEMEELQAPEKPIQYTVLRTGGNILDLVLKKPHNYGRCDTVVS